MTPAAPGHRDSLDADQRAATADADKLAEQEIAFVDPADDTPDNRDIVATFEARVASDRREDHRLDELIREFGFEPDDFARA